MGIQILDSAMREGRIARCRSGGLSRHLDRPGGCAGEQCGHGLLGNSPRREVHQRGKTGFSVLEDKSFSDGVS